MIDIDSFLKQYTNLRKRGFQPKAALKIVLNSVGTIDKSDAAKLRARIREWESQRIQQEQDGEAKPTPSPAPEPPPEAPKDATNLRNPLKSASSPHTGIINPLPFSRLDQAQKSVETNLLPPMSSPEETIAERIAPPKAAPLGGNEGANPTPDPAPGGVKIEEPPVPPDSTIPVNTQRADLQQTAYFFPKGTLVLLNMHDQPKPVMVDFGERDELIVGRRSDKAAMNPDIDLTLVGAGHSGVSRLHAKLLRRNERLFIMDMESRNHTYVNGQMLQPDELRAIKDKDRVRLGDLFILIRFHKK